MATSIWTSRPRQAASASSRTGNHRDTGTVLGQGRRKATRALWLLQLIPSLLAAQRTGVQQLFPAQPSNYLTDVANVVDGSSASTINDLAARLRTATGAELAVVTLPTIEDRAPGDVALAIGRAWGVGAKGEAGDPAKNAGIVLLLVPRTPEHKGEIYLSTGRGIEGIITDATAGRITDLMLPDLRAAQWGPALVLGTRAVVSTAVGLEGIPVDDGVHATIADTPESFAAAAIRFYDDAEMRARTGRAARQFVLDNFNRSSITEKLVALYKQLQTS